MKHVLVLLIVVISLAVAAVEELPTTVNLKNGKTITVKPDFTWNYYVPPKPVLPPPVKKSPVVVFSSLPFGTSLNRFQVIYEKQKDTMKSWPDDGVYYFDDQFAGEPATLFFYFKKDTFYHGEVVFKIRTDDEQVFWNKFVKTKAILSKIYGPPTVEKKTFLAWILDNQTIRVMLTQEKGKLYLGATYNDNALEKQLSVPSQTVTPADIKPPAGMDVATPAVVNVKSDDKENLPDIKSGSKIQYNDLKDLMDKL